MPCTDCLVEPHSLRYYGGYVGGEGCAAVFHMWIGTNPAPPPKVVVEQPGGAYVPGDVYRRQVAEQQEQRSLLTMALGIVSWDKEDAKDYESQLQFLLLGVSQRVLDMAAGAAAGLSLFMLIALYIDYDQASFFTVYSASYYRMQKLFMGLSLLLVATSLFPFAHDLAQANRPIDATATNLHSQPPRAAAMPLLRRLASPKFVVYLGALVCTIVVTSAEQVRNNASEVASMPADLRSRLHAAVVIRAILHIIGWLTMFADVPRTDKY